MKAQFLADKFARALAYEKYVANGTDEQQRRWRQVYEAAALTDPQRQLLATFERRMNVLVVSGVWCGDCVQQCPLIARIAEANPTSIDLRFIESDAQRDLVEQVRINGGERVPVALFMAEDCEVCSIFGDRTLSRYRALARKQLGAACPTGIGGPDQDETAATLQDWVDEFERIQLMLRTSPRLRHKHGD